MRYAGGWMTAADDRILEYLSENETGSPAKMKREGPIRYSRQQINRRCKRLAEENLVRHLGNGVYVITEDGEAYLEGRLDTEDWQYIDEEVREDTHDDSTEDTVTEN
ncbi:winged helix-turn-helix domain-containing protein [Halorubrum ezzemoulense DSM 17463]|uniref:Winged helix-turn-helix domain-containing protein n=1 Tax=Halorubrum ezzemoulense DSM 17463 TaxID=1121945 RepID=A0A1X4G8I3_HALEZ|nr:winged helix-turn-helix domain-containing protein [Halorubrum ezzemoulense]OSO92193.1 winged helix-turn-helix domain-containing protein [Halorubrum ezzemoulense DSM 17463]